MDIAVSRYLSCEKRIIGMDLPYLFFDITQGIYQVPSSETIGGVS